MVTLRRDILVVFRPFMTHHFYCRTVLRNVHRHVRWMLPLVVPAWETFRETTLLHPRWHQRKRTNQTKVVVVWN